MGGWGDASVLNSSPCFPEETGSVPNTHTEYSGPVLSTHTNSSQLTVTLFLGNSGPFFSFHKHLHILSIHSHKHIHINNYFKICLHVDCLDFKAPVRCIDNIFFTIFHVCSDYRLIWKFAFGSGPYDVCQDTA